MVSSLSAALLASLSLKAKTVMAAAGMPSQEPALLPGKLPSELAFNVSGQLRSSVCALGRGIEVSELKLTLYKALLVATVYTRIFELNIFIKQFVCECMAECSDSAG